MSSSDSLSNLGQGRRKRRCTSSGVGKAEKSTEHLRSALRVQGADAGGGKAKADRRTREVSFKSPNGQPAVAIHMFDAAPNESCLAEEGYAIGLGKPLKRTLSGNHPGVLFRSVSELELLQLNRTFSGRVNRARRVSLTERKEVWQRSAAMLQRGESFNDLNETIKINTSREKVGCTCAQPTARDKKGKKKKGTGKGRKKEVCVATACGGSDCSCAKYGIECHSDTCKCSGGPCGNPFKRIEYEEEAVKEHVQKVLERVN
eukprot:g24336.t1